MICIEVNGKVGAPSTEPKYYRFWLTNIIYKYRMLKDGGKWHDLHRSQCKSWHTLNEA